MAFTFRAVVTVAAATRTNTTFTKPTGTVDGDIVKVALATSAGVTVTPPSGWAEVVGSPVTYAAGAVDAHIYEHRAASDGASYTFTHASDLTNGLAASWGGGAASGAIDDVNPVTNSGSGATVTGSAISPTTAACLLILIFFGDGTASSSTTPTGMTERQDLAGATIAVALDDQSLVSSGSTGTRTSTITSQAWASFMMVVKPLVTTTRPVKMAGDWGGFAGSSGGFAG